MRTILFAVTLMVFLGAVIMNVSSQPVTDAKAVFEKKCSACHGLAKVTSKKKTPEDWVKVVNRMKGKAAKKDPSIHISDSEEKTISDYLAKEYAK